MYSKFTRTLVIININKLHYSSQTNYFTQLTETTFPPFSHIFPFTATPYCVQFGGDTETYSHQGFTSQWSAASKCRSIYAGA